MVMGHYQAIVNPIQIYFCQPQNSKLAIDCQPFFYLIVYYYDRRPQAIPAQG